MRSSAVFRTISRVLDAWLPLKARYEDIPSISVAIIHNGRAAYRRAFGYADQSKRVPATVNTQYRIASISKVFTAVAALQLVEQGRLRLSESIARYVPWFRTGSRGREPTVQQLLSHGGGVWRDGDTPHWVDDRFPTLVELQRRRFQDARVFPPNVRFKYSNFGYALLGQAIEAVSRTSYRQYLERFIFKPLAMRSTLVDYEPGRTRQLARGYGRKVLGRKRPTMPNSVTNFYAPATGLLSTSGDLLHFLSSLMAEPLTRHLLRNPLLRRMRRKVWTVGREGEGYGLGLGIDRVGKHRIFGHGGGFSGFTTSVGFDPVERLGVVVLTNANGMNASSMMQGIFGLLFHLERHLAEQLPRRLRGDVREGLYRSRWDDRFVVAVGDGYYAIDPTSNFPAKYGAHILRKGNGRLVLDRADEHDSIKEPVRFTRTKGKRHLWWGATPLEKVRKV